MKNLSNEKFDFKTGTYDYMGNKTSSLGATVILKRPSAYTHINFDDISDAIHAIKDHVSKYDTKVKLDTMQDKYLNSEAGAWGRSGT
tara:strand:+ start:321 stop:581 length:261 start_codon:yes stop_codon:yes gene_type:complete